MEGQMQKLDDLQRVNPGPNPERLSTIPALKDSLDACTGSEHLVLGDFNLHHPLLGGQCCLPTHRSRSPRRAHRAAGPDGIPNEILRDTSDLLEPQLCLIINSNIYYGH